MGSQELSPASHCPRRGPVFKRMDMASKHMKDQNTSFYLGATMCQALVGSVPCMIYFI